MTTATLQDVPALAAADPAARRRVRAAWIVGGVVLASLLLRLPGLTEPIWFDEHYRTFVRMRPENWFVLLFKEVHNFLYNGFMYLWIRVFGDAEATIRVPSLIAGYAASAVFARWVARRWGGALGVLVLAWALLSPVHYWYSTEAKNNMFSVFFAVCVLIAYDGLLERPGDRWRLAAAAGAGALGLFTDFVTLLALVPVLLVAAREAAGPGRADRRRALALATALTATITAPFLLFKLGQDEWILRDYLKHFDARQAYMLLCNYLLNGNTIFPSPPQRFYLAAGAGAVVLPLLGLGLWALRESRSGRLAIAAFLLPLAFFFAASAWIEARYDDRLHYIYQERNLLILLHLFGLAVLLGARRLPWPALRAPAAGLLLAFNVVGTGLMITIHRDVPTVSIPNPDWPAIARTLREDAAATGEPVVVFSKVPCDAVLYYNPEPRVYRFRTDAPGYLYLLSFMRQNGAGVFYCLDDRRCAPLTPAERERLDRWFVREASWNFDWIDVHRMRPREHRVVDSRSDRVTK